MNFTKSNLLKALIKNAHSSNVEQMTSACEANIFYVDAILDMANTYSIGCMGIESDLPLLYPTLLEAQSENQECIDDYAQQADDHERDEDDEYEGVVLKARITSDNEISLYDIKDDINISLPIWVGSIGSVMGN